jgi:hypothetical protein
MHQHNGRTAVGYSFNPNPQFCSKGVLGGSVIYFTYNLPLTDSRNSILCMTHFYSHCLTNHNPMSTRRAPVIIKNTPLNYNLGRKLAESTTSYLMSLGVQSHGMSLMTRCGGASEIEGLSGYLEVAWQLKWVSLAEAKLSLSTLGYSIIPPPC